MPTTSGDADRSGAFGTLVTGPEDLTGLIAYALYKQGIWEAATAGRRVLEPAARQPTGTEVGAYRQAAESMLTKFAETVVEEYRDDIADTAIRRDLTAMKTDLTGVIERSTAWRTAILTNLIAWLLSIAITFLIVFSGVPGWMANLFGRHTTP